MSHLPEDVRLQDLGDVAGDGPQKTAAGVAAGGVPEARAQRQAGSSERAGRLPRLPFLRPAGGVAGRGGFGRYGDRTQANESMKVFQVCSDLLLNI